MMPETYRFFLTAAVAALRLYHLNRQVRAKGKSAPASPPAKSGAHSVDRARGLRGEILLTLLHGSALPNLPSGNVH